MHITCAGTNKTEGAKAYISRELLDRSALVDAPTTGGGPRDADGRTALHFAAGCGLTDVVRVLLEFRANPAREDAKGKHALDKCMKGSGECARALQAAPPGLVKRFHSEFVNKTGYHRGPAPAAARSKMRDWYEGRVIVKMGRWRLRVKERRPHPRERFHKALVSELMSQSQTMTIVIGRK